jgi:chromate transporter
MLLPGPEAQQLAIYIGWRLHGTAGGVVAGAFFVLPSILVMLVLSWTYAAHGSLPAVAGLFAGLKPVVVAIVAAAVGRIGRRALRTPVDAAIAAAAFAAIAAGSLPFPAIVLGAAAGGLAFHRLRGNRSRAPQAPAEASDRPGRVGVGRFLVFGAAALLLWGIPYLGIAAARGAGSLHAREYRFFTQAAFVTFGGAYAVLAYVNQAAAGSLGWITHGQAIDGLALAETTPGPLIMVLQFVGFLAAWHRPEGMTALGSAVVGAFVTTWTTFLPGFFFVLAGAPWLDSLRRIPSLSAALGGVTSAVVGVIAHLALVFGAAVIFPAGFAKGWDVFSVLLFAAALAALLRLRLDLVAIIAAGAAAGLVRALLC